MTIKKQLLAGIAIIAATALTTTAQATDITGNVSAQIENQLVLSEDTALSFATIAADPAGDTITIDSTGSRSAANTSTFSGTSAAGGFSATGTPNAAVDISFSTGDTLTGPGAAMNLGTFVTDAGASPAFDAAGDLAFNVGASLTLNPEQVGGSYAGTYTLTVNYQ